VTWRSLLYESPWIISTIAAAAVQRLHARPDEKIRRPTAVYLAREG
jgi:hypothetical protein